MNKILRAIIVQAMFACAVARSAEQVTPGAEVETKSLGELPQITKPAPCINRPLGEYPGFCGQISTFQLLCAGLNILRKAVPLSNDDSLNAFTAKKLIRNYFSHSKSGQAFDITKHARMLVLPEMDEDTKRWSTLPKLWLSENRDLERSNFYCATIKDHSVYSSGIKIAKNPPCLLWLDVEKNNLHFHKDSCSNRYVLSHEIPSPPTQLSIGNNIYQLVGVSQGHIYASPRLSICTQILQKFLPSQMLRDTINRRWTHHGDAYVRYGSTWYVMDDETRWEAQAIDGSGILHTDPERVARALVQYYPGVPNTLLYELVADQTKAFGITAQDQDDGLLLTRDTRRPVKKVFAALIAASILDAALYSFIPLAILLIDKKSWKLAIGSSVAVACVSLYHHLQHMFPMLKNKLKYKHDKKNPRSLLGPRSPLFSNFTRQNRGGIRQF